MHPSQASGRIFHFISAQCFSSCVQKSQYCVRSLHRFFFHDGHVPTILSVMVTLLTFSVCHMKADVHSLSLETFRAAESSIWLDIRCSSSLRYQPWRLKLMSVCGFQTVRHVVTSSQVKMTSVRDDS